MEALKKAREETQQQREKVAARAAQRQAALEDRRRQIQELRKTRLAEKSMETLATPPPDQ
jgi:hypothetical protein